MLEDYLTNYYTTVYPTVCLPDPRYLASKEGLTFWCRIIALSSLPIQILTTYCILKKTPDSMKPVKSSLLNLNIWCILTGFLLAFVLTPYSFIPYYAGFCTGLATLLGVPMGIQLYLNFELTIVFLISITILFENRSSLITCNIFAIQKSWKRKFWILFNIFISLAILAPVFLNPPDQKVSKLAILKVSLIECR
ncbi:unnamed protein product [Caenorhabditis brenneri]